MNQSDIDRIKAYCEQATPGPWHYWHDDDWMAMNCYGVTTDPKADGPEDDHDKFIALTLYQATPLAGAGRHHEDTDFIANARTDLPAAIAEIERLNQAIKQNDTNWAGFIADFARDAQIQVEPTDLIGTVLRMMSDKALSADLLRAELTDLKSQLEQAKAFRDISRGLEI